MVEQFNHKEKEPGSPKVVCFEGISCCGKSTLIDGLASPDRGIEVVRFQVPRDLKDPTPEYFLANDMEKLKKAARVNGQVALLDRAYVSTLVFYTVLSEINPGFDVFPLYRWFFENVERNFSRPDHYFFVHIPPELSITRSRGIRPFNENNVWLKAPDRAVYWYERLFASLEKSVPLTILDGTKSVDLLLDDAKKELDKIIT